jgi:hypothetical protein
MLKISYFDGTTQVIHPKLEGPQESRFDGRWDLLAEAIAEGRPHTFKVIPV